MSSLSTPAADATSFRRLGRQAAIYGLAVVLGRAVSFLMLPVYTRYLSPSDYGIISLLDLTVDVAAIFFTAGATSGVQRFYFKTSDPARRARLVSTAYFLVLGLSSLGALALSALSPLIWKYGLRGAGHSWYIVIAACNFAAGTLLTMPLNFAQTTQRAQLCLAISLTKLVTQLSLNILFIVVLHMGVAGLLLSTLVTCLVLGVGLATWLLRQTGFHFDRQVVRDLRRFGVPYQLTWAGSFLLTFGDRFFLQAGPGVATVGLYGMAYQFGFLLSQLGATPFLNAWNPHRHQLVPLPAADRDRRYDEGFFYFNLLLITVAVGIAALIRPVLSVMTTPEFHPAAALVPIILLAYIAEGWSETFRFAFDVTEHTRYSTYATWIVVVVVLILYTALIPRYGAYGAAIATVIGFSLRATLVYAWAQHLWPIRYRWRRHLTLLALGISIGGVLYALPSLPIVTEVALGLGMIMLYLTLVFLFLLDREERSLIGRLVKSPRSAWEFATRAT
jgi:O-antigen/teichoic acid export membrane protein